MEGIMRKLLVILLLPVFVSAQNFNDALRLSDINPVLSAKSLSLSYSNISSNYDFGSVFSNPAGLGLNKNSLLTAGYSMSAFSNDVSFFNNKTSYSTNASNLNNIGYIYSFPTTRGSLVLAVGFQQVKDFNSSLKFSGYNPSSSMIQNLTKQNDDLPYDLGLSYGLFNNDGHYLYDSTIINGGLNQSGTILEKGSIYALTVSAASEIGRNLFLGGTFNFYSGTYTKEREYFEDDIYDNYKNATVPDVASNNFQTFYFNDVLNWELSGLDLRVGLLYKFNNNFSFGAMIKSPTVFTVKEKYTVSGESYFENNSGFDVSYPTSKIEYDITSPMEMSAGFGYRFLGVALSGQLNYVDYTQMEFSDGLNITSRSRNNKEIKDIFRSVVNYSLGAEYKIPFTSLFARAGYMYKPSPFLNDSKSFDRKFVSFGVGFVAAEVLKIDFGYQHGYWKNFGDNYGSNESRTYQDVTNNSFLFTLSYIIE